MGTAPSSPRGGSDFLNGLLGIAHAHMRDQLSKAVEPALKCLDPFLSAIIVACFDDGGAGLHVGQMVLAELYLHFEPINNDPSQDLHH